MKTLLVACVLAGAAAGFWWLSHAFRAGWEWTRRG